MITSRTIFRLTLGLVLAVCAAAPGAADESKARDRDSEKAPTTKRAAKTHTIRIKNSKFSPASLTITAGEKVVWKNDDDKDHTIIADDKSFKSDNLSPEDDFEHTFKKSGTFKYGCRYHPREKGTITVEK
ncbi:MAG TPA: cupredoxin domain-containing protein [Tepidisphaeraceae bacterium]|nr:cupredoxin domain-containing protein [Tepidisphaeraceae bacterium]